MKADSGGGESGSAGFICATSLASFNGAFTAALYNDGFGRTYPFERGAGPLPSGWLDKEYSYGGQPHAVESVNSIDGLDEYSYDPNGNMTTRLEAAVAWTQVFNSENCG